MIDQLKTLCKPGLYALINEKDRKVYLGTSTNILTSLNRNICDLKYNRHPCIPSSDSIEFLFLEEIENRNIQKIRLVFYIDYYKNLGYTLYRNFPGLRYKLSVDIRVDFRKGCEQFELVYVILKCPSHLNFICGVFRTIPEANEFIESVYKDSIYYYPVQALNSLTKEFCNTILYPIKTPIY